MKPKVLVMFDAGLGCGGVESFIMNVVRSLHTEITFDILVCTNETKAYDSEFISYGGKILRIPYYNGTSRFRQRADYYMRGLYLYRKAKEIIAENMPYVAMHCNNVFDAAPAMRAAKKNGITTIIEHGHSMPSKDHLIRRIANWIYKKIAMNNCTHYIGCSEEVCNAFFYNQEFLIINNPIDNTKFFYSKDDNYPQNYIQLVQVGRFCDTKNQEFSLKVLKVLLEKEMNAKLVLIGFNDSEYSKRILKLIDTYNLNEKVSIYPTTADIPVLLKNANAYIMPSKSEGFGIAAIEAQAVGLKCYLSDVIPKTTNCGGCTYISLNKNYEEWANIIINDFKHNKLIHEQYVCETYSLENIRKQLKKIYIN